MNKAILQIAQEYCLTEPLLDNPYDRLELSSKQEKFSDQAYRILIDIYEYIGVFPVNVTCNCDEEALGAYYARGEKYIYLEIYDDLQIALLYNVTDVGGIFVNEPSYVEFSDLCQVILRELYYKYLLSGKKSNNRR